MKKQTLGSLEKKTSSFLIDQTNLLWINKENEKEHNFLQEQREGYINGQSKKMSCKEAEEVMEQWLLLRGRDSVGDDRVGKRGCKTDKYIERSLTKII